VCVKLANMTAVLSAIGLTKSFGDVTAVSNLTFEVTAGSVTGLEHGVLFAAVDV